MLHHYFTPGRLLLLGGLAVLPLAAARAQTSQPYTLQGRITDERGQGLPGVTVLLAGTTLGTATDAEGNYQLTLNQAPGPYRLTLSAIGFKTETRAITLGTSTAVVTNVTLNSASQALDNVVVIGSTVSVNRRELGNAITVVDGAQLQKTGTGQLLNALQGKVAGAQITQNSGDPSGSMSIKLRGITSLSGSSDPLYVIDGVIVSNQSTNVSQRVLSNDIGVANPGQNRLADINPNDIESLNVLNGAAAAAIYGSRASNGVVIITTKRGKSGAPRVSAYTSFQLNELRKSVPVNTYGKQFGFQGLRLYTIGGISPAQIAANPGTTTTPVTRANATTQLASNLVDVPRYDYFKEIFRTASGTDNGVSISGGSERTQYFVSAGYLKNQGIIKDTDFTRYNLRARVDQRLTSWAKVSAGVSYINSSASEKANGNVFYSPINAINITNNIYDITRRDSNGNLLAVEPTRVNPLSTIEDMKFTQATNRTISDLQVNLTPFKGFSFDYILGVDAYSQVGQGYIRPYPYQATAGLPAARYPDGFASDANNTEINLNSDVNLGYEYNFSEDFKLNLRAGYNYQYLRNSLATQQGQFLTPFITTVRGASSASVQADYSLAQSDLNGFYGQATVGYRNLAFLTGALRRDGSSRFSSSETNQYYPKVSGSLVLSDLGAWQNAAFAQTFNTLKLRASYGDAGNLNGIGPYDRLYQFNAVPFPRNALVPGAQLANNRVRPERLNELEGGVDLGFFGDRLGLSVTVYRQKITDLVVARNLAPTTGGSSIIDNVGTMENKGLEVLLNGTAIRTTDFSWDMTAVFSRNRNKVLSLPGSNGNVQAIAISNSAGAPVYLLQGQPAGVFYGSTYARNPDGSLLLTSQGFPQDERTSGQAPGSVSYVPSRGADGQPSYAPGTTVAQAIIGNPNPDWTGSFSTNFTYKKLGLRVLLDAVQGVDVFNADKRTRQGVGLGDLAEKELRGELPRGYIFAIYNTQQFRVDDGSYVKLREVALSYGLPTFSKYISALDLSLIGRNLYSWDNYNGFDPETSAGGSSDLLRAIDFGNVPIPRSYQIRLAATF
ncbi:SusC/RagA family TonB-linked outer membrane protein [Hymenobacter rubripertinctus]|uniref:SusC/RagA family TonB-linked outer membrane protein n=1 Tax=Hymenobacter rubripertinctus TaxID=2029981 RepID=A0A418QST6_9BACT|nr:SusC/RagA family TonB-linked outer membrane protein [Hymenobacter rubripertinctus]RIY08194.1 SusC/RagA family TonB-linked outer membrane protein [Hymenobacter rubripertinctus]